jgi:hypothetical protein
VVSPRFDVPSQVFAEHLGLDQVVAARRQKTDRYGDLNLKTLRNGPWGNRRTPVELVSLAVAQAEHGAQRFRVRAAAENAETLGAPCPVTSPVSNDKNNRRRPSSLGGSQSRKDRTTRVWPRRKGFSSLGKQISKQPNGSPRYSQGDVDFDVGQKRDNARPDLEKRRVRFVPARFGVVKHFESGIVERIGAPRARKREEQFPARVNLCRRRLGLVSPVIKGVQRWVLEEVHRPPFRNFGKRAA